MPASLPAPSIRTAVLAAVALPLVAVAAVLAFAWPAARLAPRELPVGIVGISPTSQQLAERLDRSTVEGFDIHVYPGQAAARRGIERRDVYGAFVPDRAGLTVLTAGAAGPAVAQLLTTTGARLAHGVAAADTGAGSTVRTVDVAPTSRDDPRGVVFSSVLLPLTICSILLAAALELHLRTRPAWRQVVALAILSGVVGLGGYLIAQPFLGALPHDHVASWAALTLAVFAVSSSTAGLVGLLGLPGFGTSAALMMFLGNGFSGVTSAPEMLPDAVHRLGQLLPPGAAANLLRSTAYFGDHGAGDHVAVLLVWAVLGSGAVVVGRRFTPGRVGEHEEPRAASAAVGDPAEAAHHRVAAHAS